MDPEGIYSIAHKEEQVQLVIFQVEGKLYRLRQDKLLQSSVFTTMLDLPPPAEGAEGRSPDRPITLSGITAFEFEIFAKVLYASIYERPLDPFKFEEGEAVLHLATMWEFELVREFAIRWMDENKIESRPLDEIRLGRECGVEKWLHDGLFQLVVRPDPLTVEDAMILGLDTAINLIKVREEELKCQHCSIWMGAEHRECHPIDRKQWLEWGKDHRKQKSVQTRLLKHGVLK